MLTEFIYLYTYILYYVSYISVSVRPKMCVLGSREQLCINQEVMRQESNHVKVSPDVITATVTRLRSGGFLLNTDPLPNSGSAESELNNLN